MDPTLLILSDSHGNPHNIARALRRVKPSGVLFAGDGVWDLADIPASDLPDTCPVWAVRGNMDAAWRYPTVIIGGRNCAPAETECFEWQGLRILLCHGHGPNVKSGLSLLIREAVENRADAAVFGHTHEPFEYYLPAGSACGDMVLAKPLYLFNPGSIGCGYPPSFGTLTVRGGVPLFGHGTL